MKSFKEFQELDPELKKLILGLMDADEAGDKVGYLQSLTEAKRNKLLDHMVQEVAAELRRKEN